MKTKSYMTKFESLSMEELRAIKGGWKPSQRATVVLASRRKKKADLNGEIEISDDLELDLIG